MPGKAGGTVKPLKTAKVAGKGAWLSELLGGSLTRSSCHLFCVRHITHRAVPLTHYSHTLCPCADLSEEDKALHEKQKAEQKAIKEAAAKLAGGKKK